MQQAHHHQAVLTFNSVLTYSMEKVTDLSLDLFLFGIKIHQRLSLENCSCFFVTSDSFALVLRLTKELRSINYYEHLIFEICYY